MTWPLSRAWRRARLVAALLRPRCEDCGADPGVTCDPLHEPAAQLIRIDRHPFRAVHSSRAAAAAASGCVSRSLLTAQFAGGTLPAGLTRTSTARR